MSRTLAVSATMLLILFLTPSTGSAQDNVQEVEAEWARALVAGDLPALNALYADDLVYVHSNGSVDTKQQWLGLIETGRVSFSSAEAQNKQVRNYGNTAVVNALYNVVLNSRQMAIQYLTVFVMDDERWRIVTQQTATLPDGDR